MSTTPTIRRTQSILTAAATLVVLTLLTTAPASAAPATPDRGAESVAAWSWAVPDVLTGLWDRISAVWDEGRNFADPDGEPAALWEEGRNFADPDGAPTAVWEEGRNFADPDGGSAAVRTEGFDRVQGAERGPSPRRRK